MIYCFFTRSELHNNLIPGDPNELFNGNDVRCHTLSVKTGRTQIMCMALTPIHTNASEKELMNAISTFTLPGEPLNSPNPGELRIFDDRIIHFMKTYEFIIQFLKKPSDVDFLEYCFFSRNKFGTLQLSVPILIFLKKEFRCKILLVKSRVRQLTCMALAPLKQNVTNQELLDSISLVHNDDRLDYLNSGELRISKHRFMLLTNTHKFLKDCMNQLVLR